MKKNYDKLFWGVFFILGAVFILVSQLGLLHGVNIVTLIFAVCLAGIFMKSLFAVEFTGMLFSLAFLAILFDDQLHITQLTPWPVLGAALFGSIGLGILFRKPHVHDFSGKEEHFDKVIDIEDGSQINYGTSFGSSIKYVNSDDFRQANIDCSFGAMKIYFDKAVIQNGCAVVNLHVSFAGVEIYVPKEWQIENQVSVSLGALEEKNRSYTNGSPVLTLTGTVSFSGVEIVYI